MCETTEEETKALISLCSRLMTYIEEQKAYAHVGTVECIDEAFLMPEEEQEVQLAQLLWMIHLLRCEILWTKSIWDILRIRCLFQ